MGPRTAGSAGPCGHLAPPADPLYAAGPESTRVSRTYESLRRAEEARRGSPPPPPRRTGSYRVVCVTSNKGGVGKTTVATNLAVYVRALREDLPVLVLSLDDQLVVDRMFRLDRSPPKETVATVLRTGHLGPAIRLGQYGVHYVPSSLDISQAKARVDSPRVLRRVLDAAGFPGLVIVDTKSDLEILTRSALLASDLALVVVKDHASVVEALKVFDLLRSFGLPKERGRVLFSLVDQRIKFSGEGGVEDVLGVLLAASDRFALPHLSSFVARSPKVESLATNPSGRIRSVLHGAPGSRVHRQLRALAEEVLEVLEL